MPRHIRPSECTRCVPIETITTGSMHGWTVETAHQTECPNSPKEKN